MWGVVLSVALASVPPRSHALRHFEFDKVERQALYDVLIKLGFQVDLNRDPCLWPGLNCVYARNCSGADQPPGYIGRCEAEPEGYSLELRRKGFKMKLPDKLGKLKHLAHLDLSFNEFHGPLPVSLFRLFHLEGLILSHNHLEGPLWSDVKYLDKLRLLDLSNNKLNGTLPPLTALTELGGLVISNNQFSGKLAGLPSRIRLLFAQNNTFSELDVAGLEQIRTLDAAENNLATLPPLPASLSRVYLHHNGAGGPSPDLAGLSGLDTVFLQHNRLSGPVPACPPSVSELHLGHNQLTGTLPTMAGMTRLRVLDLDDNHIEGTLPPDLGNLTQLHSLFLGHNDLHGPIPASFAKLAQVDQLWLQHNRLTGKVPPAVAAMQGAVFGPFEIHRLDFDDNLLEGWVGPQPPTTTTTTTKFCGELQEWYPDGQAAGQPCQRKQPPPAAEHETIRMPDLPPVHLRADHSALPRFELPQLELAALDAQHEAQQPDAQPPAALVQGGCKVRDIGSACETSEGAEGECFRCQSCMGVVCTYGVGRTFCQQAENDGADCKRGGTDANTAGTEGVCKNLDCVAA